MSNYNNVLYELLIHNIVTSNFGIYESNNTFTNKPISTKLNKIMNTSEYISKMSILLLYIYIFLYFYLLNLIFDINKYIYLYK